MRTPLRSAIIVALVLVAIVAIVAIRAAVTREHDENALRFTFEVPGGTITVGADPPVTDRLVIDTPFSGEGWVSGPAPTYETIAEVVPTWIALTAPGATLHSIELGCLWREEGDLTQTLRLREADGTIVPALLYAQKRENGWEGAMVRFLPAGWRADDDRRIIFHCAPLRGPLAYWTGAPPAQMRILFDVWPPPK